MTKEISRKKTNRKTNKMKEEKKDVVDVDDVVDVVDVDHGIAVDIELNERMIVQIDVYKPFISVSFHQYFDSLPLLLSQIHNDDFHVFLNFFIFTLCFHSLSNSPLDKFHFINTFNNMRHIPFHSLLNSFRCSFI
jgi:hypothetical protein